VFLYSSIADISEAKSKYIETINTNIIGAANVFDASSKAKVKRLIFASTMYVYSVYGSFYRASKQSSEILLETFSDEFDLKYTILRFGSIYGPGAQDWNGMKRYITEIFEKGSLTYWGSGEEKRDYIHIHDATMLTIKAMQDDAYVNRAVTITGQQVLSAMDLINLLFEIIGVDKDYKFTGIDKEHGHYVISPYKYKPIRSIKLVPDKFIDIGQGILEVVEEVALEKEASDEK